MLTSRFLAPAALFCTLSGLLPAEPKSPDAPPPPPTPTAAEVIVPQVATTALSAPVAVDETTTTQSAETPLPPSERPAMRPGEAFTFRIGWGPFGHAGDIVVAAQREDLVAGLPDLKVTTTMATRGIVRALYKFESEAGARYDLNSGRLLSASETTTAGKSRQQTSVLFDYSAGQGTYTDHLRPKRNTTLEIPDGPMLDLLSALVQGRAWKVWPGESRKVFVLFDDDFYEIDVKVEGVENVRTDLGTFQTLVLHPTMDNNPRGLFKRGGGIRVWISMDERKLPVKIEVKVKVGTATATLVDYTPPEEPAPVSPVPAEASPAAPATVPASLPTTAP